MPDSNLARVAAWLAEEERKKLDAEDQPVPQQPGEDRVFTNTKGGVHSYIQTPNSIMGGDDETPDPTGEEARSLRERGYRWLPQEDYAGALAQAQQAADGAFRPPPGKLPFISGTPTHAATKPAFAYMPTVANPGMAEAMAGAASLAKPGVKGPASLPSSKKADPKATLARARGTREVTVRSTKEGIQPTLREPVDPLASRGATPALPPRVSTFLQGRRPPSGLEDAQRRANVNQLSANLGQSAEYLAAGVGGVRPRPEAYANLQEQAGQPVKQYQQQHAEQRQQEQDDAALAEAQREAERAAAEMTFKQGRATSEDQLARDRLAQEKAIAEGRLRSDAADRGLRREEMRFRQKEGAELKRQLAQEKEQALSQRQDEKDQMELAKRLQAASDAKGDLDLVMRYATSPEGEDIPGIGWGVSGLPGAVVSQEGSDLRQAAIRLYRNKVRMESGQTVTPQEAATALEARGMGTWKTEGQWRAGMKALAGETAAAMRNIESGFNPSIVATRRERGGITSADIPTAPVVMQAPDGQQYEVAQDEMVEAQRNGWRRVR